MDEYSRNVSISSQIPWLLDDNNDDNDNDDDDDDDVIV
jgi:hypothetical protein